MKNEELRMKAALEVKRESIAMNLKKVRSYLFKHRGKAEKTRGFLKYRGTEKKRKIKKRTRGKEVKRNHNKSA